MERAPLGVKLKSAASRGARKLSMSSSDTAISVRGLSKSYTIVHGQQRRPTFRDLVMDRLRNPFKRDQKETFWALKDVSFDIKRGEAVGIIGRNGAGKSTLLKILSRITEPTTGEIDLYGRVGSLLEVGTGFHPELTGRENIFLNGAILGMSRAEIRRQFDAIVDFAEVEKFLDTPVKRYSSGMYVRLAFAVAAHLSAEILIVDEVLAVGDAVFQKKCLAKMSEVADVDGRTVILVSHNLSAVQSMCRRCIWLRGGEVAADGAPRGVILDYQATSVSSDSEVFWEHPDSAPGTEAFRLKRACVRPSDRSKTVIDVRTFLTFEFEYWNLRPGIALNLSLSVVNEVGTEVFSSFPATDKVWHGKAFPAGLFRTTCVVPGDLLNNGRYTVNLLAVRDQSIVLWRKDSLLTFHVEDSHALRGDWHGEWNGVVRPNLKWETERVGGLASEAWPDEVAATGGV